MRSITLSGHKSRRLDLHQHDPVYKTGASLFGHVGKYASGPKTESVFTSTFPTWRSSTLTQVCRLKSTRKDLEKVA